MAMQNAIAELNISLLMNYITISIAMPCILYQTSHVEATAIHAADC